MFPQDPGSPSLRENVCVSTDVLIDDKLNVPH